MADETFLPCDNSMKHSSRRKLQYKHYIYNCWLYRGRWVAGSSLGQPTKGFFVLAKAMEFFCGSGWTVRYQCWWTANLQNEKNSNGVRLFYQKEQQIQGLRSSVLWRMMWQIAGKIIKPSSVVSLLWFIFWRKACLIFSRKYQEACFVTHTNGPYFDTVARHSWSEDCNSHSGGGPYFDIVARHSWSEDCNSHSGGSVATGSLPCLTGQRWWPRWKRIPWSSRLVAGTWDR